MSDTSQNISVIDKNIDSENKFSNIEDISNHFQQLSNEIHNSVKFNNELSNDFGINTINFDKKVPLKNRVYYGRYYYTRPTCMDVLFEENFVNSDGSSFVVDSIYKWNIDGLSKHAIYIVLHKMVIYATICEADNNSDKQVAEFITACFTGQLKYWWDNILNCSQRFEILNVVKSVNMTDPSTSTIKQEVSEDSVYTLIQHFIGNEIHNMDRTKELLINLRCPT